MTARDVNDPHFDATPGVGDHQPIIVQLLGDTGCMLGTCEHQGPDFCPTTGKKVCRPCTLAEVALDAPLQERTGAAMRWPCQVARSGGAW